MLNTCVQNCHIKPHWSSYWTQWMFSCSGFSFSTLPKRFHLLYTSQLLKGNSTIEMKRKITLCKEHLGAVILGSVGIVSTASPNVALDPSLACKMATIVSVVPSKYLWTLKNELHEEFWKAQIWTYQGTKIQKLQAPCHIISHSTKPWGGVDHKQFWQRQFWQR